MNGRDEDLDSPLDTIQVSAVKMFEGENTEIIQKAPELLRSMESDRLNPLIQSASLSPLST
jgi:hypothetical protein